MERYQLKSDETVLYEGEVTKADKYKKESFMDSFSTPPAAELMLTNKNIILTTRIKKMFSKEQINVEVFSLVDIKVYDDYLKSSRAKSTLRYIYRPENFISVFIQNLKQQNSIKLPYRL